MFIDNFNTFLTTLIILWLCYFVSKILWDSRQTDARKHEAVQHMRKTEIVVAAEMKEKRKQDEAAVMIKAALKARTVVENPKPVRRAFLERLANRKTTPWTRMCRTDISSALRDYLVESMIPDDNATSSSVAAKNPEGVPAIETTTCEPVISQITSSVASSASLGSEESTENLSGTKFQRLKGRLPNPFKKNQAECESVAGKKARFQEELPVTRHRSGSGDEAMPEGENISSRFNRFKGKLATRLRRKKNESGGEGESECESIPVATPEKKKFRWPRRTDKTRTSASSCADTLEADMDTELGDATSRASVLDESAPSRRDSEKSPVGMFGRLKGKLSNRLRKNSGHHLNDEARETGNRWPGVAFHRDGSERLGSMERPGELRAFLSDDIVAPPTFTDGRHGSSPASPVEDKPDDLLAFIDNHRHGVSLAPEDRPSELCGYIDDRIRVSPTSAEGETGEHAFIDDRTEGISPVSLDDRPSELRAFISHSQVGVQLPNNTDEESGVRPLKHEYNPVPSFGEREMPVSLSVELQKYGNLTTVESTSTVSTPRVQDKSRLFELEPGFKIQY